MHWTGHTEKFDLDAPYQRGSVWTIEQRRNLIKSLLMGLPVGSIIVSFLGYSAETAYRIVDGKQRIQTVQMFFRNEFSVPGHWFNTSELTDSAARERDITFSDLSQSGEMHFEMGKLPSLQFDATTEITEKPDGHSTGRDRYDFRKRTPDEMLQAEAELYLLVNFGGVAQTDTDRARAQEVADR